jgi:putative hydrolase of the HAD superfamily
MDKMIKNVIFDLGRVLINFKPMEYLTSLGFGEEKSKILNDLIFKSDYWYECDRGIYSNTELAEILCKENNKFENEIKTVLAEEWVNMLTLKEDTVKFLKDLKKDGYNIYILSNLSEQSHDYLKNYDFFKYVDGGVFSYKLNICKPDPRIYKELFSKYSIKPEESVFIDDLQINIDAAKKLGLNGIVFDNINTVKNKFYSIVNE